MLIVVHRVLSLGEERGRTDLVNNSLSSFSEVGKFGNKRSEACVITMSSIHANSWMDRTIIVCDDDEDYTGRWSMLYFTSKFSPYKR